MTNQTNKKIFLAFLVSFLFSKISLSFSFEIPYQYLIDYNDEKLLIKTKNFQEISYYLCFFQNLKCEKYEEKTKIKLYNLEDSNILYPSSDFKYLLSQKKINNLYLTYLLKKNQNSLEVSNILPINIKIKQAYFSKDNKKIILFSQRKVFIIDIESNKIVDEFKLNLNFSFLAISPSLKYLFYYKPVTLTNQKRQYFIFDIENRKRETFLEEEISYWDLLTENTKLAEFLDDENLIFLSDKDNYQTLYLYNISSNKTERLINEDFIIKNFKIVSSSIYFIGNKETKLRWDLYSFNLENKDIKKILDNVAYDFNLFEINNYLVIKETAEKPPTIVLLNLSTLEKRYLDINLNQEKLKLGEPKNLEDIHYVFLTPENFDINRPVNLLIWLHGGPHRQSSLGYHPYFSYGKYDYLLEKIRQEGFMIIKLDYRGSFGYGRDFADLREKVGSKDVESVIKVVENLKSNYRLNKIFLIGNSYGGYLSLKSIYERPDIFEGAISINGVTDWFNLIKKNPYSIFSIHFNGKPQDLNLNLYNQASIFLEKNRLKDKSFLIIYSEKDRTVPSKNQAVLFKREYNEIAKIKLISYPDEKHIISNLENFKDLCKNIFDFLDLDSPKCNESK